MINCQSANHQNVNFQIADRQKVDINYYVTYPNLT
jgi:hypothetical protein